MPEVTKELMYKLLKQIDHQLGGLSQDVSEVKSELGSIRRHLVATEGDLKNMLGVLTRQDASLERIERHLGPHQFAENQRQ